jgi:hypothetical protein
VHDVGALCVRERGVPRVARVASRVMLSHDHAVVAQQRRGPSVGRVAYMLGDVVVVQVGGMSFCRMGFAKPGRRGDLLCHA